MRILIIQSNGRHDANRIYRECFALQRAFQCHGDISADVWGIGHANFKASIDFNAYEVIIIVERFDTVNWIPLDLIRKSTAYKLLWAIDSHSGLGAYRHIQEQYKIQTMLCSIKHHVGNNAVWFPNAYDDMLIKPLQQLKVTDLGFCGNLGGVERESILEMLKLQLKQRFKLDVMVIGDEMVAAICGYKVHFNKNVSDDINYRNFETLGCGVPLLTNYNYQYDDLGFKHDVNCLLYKATGDIIPILDTFLQKSSEEQRLLAQGGLELVKTRHTFRHRVNHLLKFLKTCI